MTSQNRIKKIGLFRSAYMLTVGIIVMSLALTGCSPSVRIMLSPEGNGTANFTASLSPTADSLIRRFSSQGNTQKTLAEGESDTPLFDKKKIEDSLLKAGIHTESITFPKGTDLSLVLSFKKMDGILNNAIKINTSQKEAHIKISPQTVASAVAIMPDDTKDYLELLMAPIFTDEELSTPEYIEIIAMAYGKTLSSELAKSVFQISISTPAIIQTITPSEQTRGSVIKKTPKEAVITIPLAELLTLRDEISFKISWQ